MATLDRAGDAELLDDDLLNDRQQLERYHRWFDQAHRANDEWRAAAIESRRFVSGDQWGEADRAKLSRAQRPFLTINKILPRVLFLAGLQRSQRQEPKLLPFEGGDVRSSELMGALYKWAGTQSREAVVDSKVFEDKIITGLAYWKLSWCYDRDLEGELRWERVDPLAVFPDPNWLDAGWDHAEYVIQATWMTLRQAEEHWPEHAEEIRRSYGEWLSESSSATHAQFGGGEFAGDPFSGDRNYWDPQTQRLRVLEVWYKRRVSVEAAMHAATGEVTTDPRRVAFLRAAAQSDPTLQGGINFFRVPVTKVHLAHVTQDLVLDDDLSPYRSQVIPLFPTVGFYWWKTPFGIVEPMKDLQREKNRRRSTIIEMIMRAALSGFFNQADQGAKTEDLENYATGIAKVIPFKNVQPAPIAPPELPQTLVFLDTQADRDMDAVSNIHGELLGTSTQRTVSGRAIKARQQSGLVVQEPLLESFVQDKEPAARFAVDLIKQFMSPSKALRILGSIAVRQQQGPEAQMLQGMAFAEVQDLLSGAFSQDFDVVIGMKPWEPSAKQQQWSIFSELVQQFGPWIPPDVIVEAGKDAGLLTEAQAARTVAFIQERLAQQAAQQAAAGGEPPGPPALPGLAA